MVEKWKLALREFLKKYEEDDDVVGAILCGSYASGNNNNYSNINVYLVLKDRCSYKEMGCVDSNSYLIEYYMNPSYEIEKCMNEEYLNGLEKTANMLAYGKIIYDLDGSVKSLQEKALNYIDKKLEDITRHKLDMNNYQLWYYLDKLNVTLKENNPNFNLIYYSLLEDVYNKYAEVLQLPKLPKTKIYKILTDEDYRRECHVFNLPEEKFIKLYVKCFELDKPSAMYKNMENLINYYYEKQGGFNIRTFKIKSKIERNY